MTGNLIFPIWQTCGVWSSQSVLVHNQSVCVQLPNHIKLLFHQPSNIIAVQQMMSGWLKSALVLWKHCVKVLLLSQVIYFICFNPVKSDRINRDYQISIVSGWHNLSPLSETCWLRALSQVRLRLTALLNIAEMYDWDSTYFTLNLTPSHLVVKAGPHWQQWEAERQSSRGC